MYYFYALENEVGGLYFGSTYDLRKRLSEHNSGRSLATRNHHWKLIYYEAFLAESDARAREQRIKEHGQAKSHLLRRLQASRLRKS